MTVDLATLCKFVCDDLQKRVDDATNCAINVRADTCETIALSVTSHLAEARAYGRSIAIIQETFRKLTQPPKPEQNNLTAKQEPARLYG